MFCTNCGNNIEGNSRFCINCGQDNNLSKLSFGNNKLTGWIKNHKKSILIFIGIVTLLFIIVSISGDNFSKIENSSYNQIVDASAVVNIFCPSIVSDEESSGGSGTIISEDGIIITNSHIIPQNENDLEVDEAGCLVVLADPATGQATDFYMAHPVVLTGLSDKYDLAFMEIYSAYFDDEKQEYTGVYPRKFPIYKCENNIPKLGDSVRVYGYPSLSGGYTLTVTEGIISSFSGDGLIYTSAKISHGNSGGLAVDRNGCMIGVPSMVSTDENSSLGIIYSMDLVNEFADEVSKIE